MTSRPHRVASFAVAIAFGLLASACAGSSADSNPEAVDVTGPAGDSTVPIVNVPIETLPIGSIPPAATPVATLTTAPLDTTPLEPGTGTVSADGDATWAGGDFVALAGARMDELASVFGQPATAAGLAPTFDLPADFPYPAGTVVGTFRVFERDLRVTDAVVVEEERIVGVDGANDVASFDAFGESLAADATTRWERSSSQRDGFVNDLFTAASLDGGATRDRLFLEAQIDPLAGQPPVSFSYSSAPTEIPVPNWQAGLPILDGGQVASAREGRGLVEDSGRLAEDGHIELRIFYPIERYDELEAFFASGLIAAAGFEYDDTPFSNFDIRVDVSQGDWTGTVGLGGVNVNNEDTGYELIWSLTRPVGSSTDG